MARQKKGNEAARDGGISIIAAGTRIVGDCETEGTVRIEGTVEGTVRAAKAVVVARGGVVDGDVFTQDAVIAGRISGTLVAESRLELQATCVVEGEIRARRIRLDEGGRVNGRIQTGESRATNPAVPPPSGLFARGTFRDGEPQRRPGPAEQPAGATGRPGIAPAASSARRF